MDHFIHWSFVKDDQIWNLVFSCSHCNETKNNKIPSYDYLNKLIERNKNILNNSFDIKQKNLRKKLTGKKKLILEVLLYFKMFLCYFWNLRLKLMILL